MKHFLLPGMQKLSIFGRLAVRTDGESGFNILFTGNA
jgi:hypothetical protein